MGDIDFCIAYSISQFLNPPVATNTYAVVGVERENMLFEFGNSRNMLAPEFYKLEIDSQKNQIVSITILKPDQIESYFDDLINELKIYRGFETITRSDILQYIKLSDNKIILTFSQEKHGEQKFKLVQNSQSDFMVYLNDHENFDEYKQEIIKEFSKFPILSSIKMTEIEALYESADSRPFFLLYVSVLIIVGLIIITLRSNSQSIKKEKINFTQFGIVIALGMLLWLIPGLTIISRIISFIIYFTVTSLFIIDSSDKKRYIDHAKFLLMIFLYSGFWVLYFQMFDSVLWYVQAYVNASALNNSINEFLGFLGFSANWFFDVEHVTVINAGTIILLQLLISSIVKKRQALPTMITGIAIATIGMVILAISADIWVFIIGIFLFSIGEMTAHPKFISYIGLIAPADKKAMYMGYLFLYGVFGSSIGGILGAKLYVHFVDNLNQPSTLWIIFSMIGVVTIIGLLLYNKFFAPKKY